MKYAAKNIKKVTTTILIVILVPTLVIGSSFFLNNKGNNSETDKGIEVKAINENVLNKSVNRYTLEIDYRTFAEVFINEFYYLNQDVLNETDLEITFYFDNLMNSVDIEIESDLLDESYNYKLNFV